MAGLLGSGGWVLRVVLSLPAARLSINTSIALSAADDFFLDLETSLQSGSFRKLTLSVTGAENAAKELDEDGSRVAVLWFIACILACSF
jgi:hypothetical protein